MGQVHDFIRRRPALHLVCGNTFLATPIRVSDNMALTPLRPMGAGLEASYIAALVDLLGYEVDEGLRTAIKTEGETHRPATLCTIIVESGDTVREIESAGLQQAAFLKMALAWVTQKRADTLAVIAAGPKNFSWRLGDVHEPRTMCRMSFGDPGRPLRQIIRAAEIDRRFRFSLSQFTDTLGEADPEFLMARCFVCMEGLASEQKGGDTGSREAIRLLCKSLNVPHETHVLNSGETTAIDVVEISGRVRQKLMHGIPFDRDLPGWLRDLLSRDDVQAVVVGAVVSCCESVIEELAKRILASDPDSAGREVNN